MVFLGVYLETKEKQEDFNKLLTDFKKEGVPAVWCYIKNKVFDLLFEEFSPLYSNNKKDRNLLGTVEIYEHLPIDDMDGFLKRNQLKAFDLSSVVNQGLFSTDKAAGEKESVKNDSSTPQPD